MYKETNSADNSINKSGLNSIQNNCMSNLRSFALSYYIFSKGQNYIGSNGVKKLIKANFPRL